MIHKYSCPLKLWCKTCMKAFIYFVAVVVSAKQSIFRHGHLFGLCSWNTMLVMIALCAEKMVRSVFFLLMWKYIYVDSLALRPCWTKRSRIKNSQFDVLHISHPKLPAWCETGLFNCCVSSKQMEQISEIWRVERLREPMHTKDLSLRELWQSLV